MFFILFGVFSSLHTEEWVRVVRQNRKKKEKCWIASVEVITPGFEPGSLDLQV